MDARQYVGAFYLYIYLFIPSVCVHCTGFVIFRMNSLAQLNAFFCLDVRLSERFGSATRAKYIITPDLAPQHFRIDC